MSDAAPTPPPRKGFLSALGPAIITASVVLGPGSILANSQTGAIFGYQFVWFLMLAVILMVVMTALSTRIGVLINGSMGEEIARRAGRPLSILVGVTIFLIAACFQFSNNLGVLAAVEPFETGESKFVSIGILVAINLIALAALFIARDIYTVIEKMMKVLIAMMVVGFIGNLIMAKPDLGALARGFIPSLPEGSAESLIPREGGPNVLGSAMALFATTFSLAAAYYQSYLVRQKGWTKADYRTSVVDTLMGIGMLGLISLVIMCTASAAFFGSPVAKELNTAADFAKQLEPTFGAGAKYLFCAGIFAGAFSSFLVNALIGGAMLSDGCGLGAKMEDKWVRVFTAIALVMGFLIAVYMVQSGQRPVRLIIFAQGATILGGPLVAIVLIWMATRPDLKPNISTKLIVFATVAMIVTFLVAARKAIELSVS